MTGKGERYGHMPVFHFTFWGSGHLFSSFQILSGETQKNKRKPRRIPMEALKRPHGTKSFQRGPFGSLRLLTWRVGMQPPVFSCEASL